MTATASLYLGLEPSEPTGDTSEDLYLRWRAMAARLRAEGADERTLAAIGQHLADLRVYPTEVAVFAAAGELRMARSLPGGARYDLASFGAPARVGPLLAWLRGRPPHVIVAIDRTGADLVSAPRGALTGAERSVLGPDDEIERNAPGGWSQPRYQRRAEDSWQHNAAAVATAVVEELHRVRGDLVLVAGDVRATQLLRDRLARMEHGVDVRRMPGGRGADGSAANRPAAVAQLLDAYVAERTAAALAQLNEAAGPDGRAVQGLCPTLAALAAGQVETLLVADDPADTRPAWFGDHLWAAPSPGDRTALGHACRRGRMVDVAVRAGLLTGADVWILTAAEAAGLPDGIGGLRRYH
ncbi:baeRF2 domain-containing protein [Phytohabitans houttuyneae]|nr:Vms1/Ankzf1 family peptidyl-tRNA hydrolase [Phytohabitans houttuyneae]